MTMEFDGGGVGQVQEGIAGFDGEWETRGKE